jgi:quercetin dioxygenase-like cupin family protein
MTFVLGGSTGPWHVPAGDGPAHWMVGDTYTLKASGVSTRGALGLVEASIPPGSGPPQHRHEFEDEAIYLLAGSLEIRGDENDVMEAATDDFDAAPRYGVELSPPPAGPAEGSLDR